MNSLVLSGALIMSIDDTGVLELLATTAQSSNTRHHLFAVAGSALWRRDAGGGNRRININFQHLQT